MRNHTLLSISDTLIIQSEPRKEENTIDYNTVTMLFIHERVIGQLLATIKHFVIQW